MALLHFWLVCRKAAGSPQSTISLGWRPATWSPGSSQQPSFRLVNVQQCSCPTPALRAVVGQQQCHTPVLRTVVRHWAWSGLHNVIVNDTSHIIVNEYVTCLMIKDDSLGDTVILVVDGFTYLLHLEMCKKDKSYCTWNSLDFISITRYLKLIL